MASSGCASRLDVRADQAGHIPSGNAPNGGQLEADLCARSSVGQSIELRSQRPQVRILSGAPNPRKIADLSCKNLRGLDQRSAHCRACSTRRHKTFGQRRRSSGPSSVRFQGGRAGAEIEDRRYLSEIHGARMIAIRDPRTVLHVHPQRNPAIRRTPLRSSRRP